MSSQPPELGPTRRGPEFMPPTAGQLPAGQQAYPGHGPYAPLGRDAHRPSGGGPKPEPPPTNRWPTIITFGTIFLVVAIVLIAVLRPDSDVVPESSDSPTPSVSAAPQDTGSSIGFTSSEGTGRLTLLSHHWSSDSGAANRAYLAIKVKIEATEGRISYGPQYFQTFDARSELFRTTEVGAPTPLLGNGYLDAGQSVVGGISFDMPRGDVTLLMSNARLESVTALRIS